MKKKFLVMVAVVLGLFVTAVIFTPKDGKDVQEVKQRFESFILEGKKIVPASDIFPENKNSPYDQICIFIDSDPASDSDTAEVAFYEYLALNKKYIDIRDTNYYAIITLKSGNNIKAFPLKNPFYINGNLYGFWFDMPFLYKGCVPYQNTVFQIEQFRDSSYIVLTNQH